MQKTLAILLVGAILLDCGNAEAQSTLLPQCASAARQGNCSDTVTYPYEGKYVGEFRDGKRHGQGTFTWASGSKYVGEYRDGKINGQGTYTFANGSKYVGYWNDGQYVGAAPPTNFQSASPPPQAAVADPLVAAIQALLSALGFEPGAADGVNGPQTAKAIALFQTAIGDKVDGQPSDALRTKLQKAVAERSVSPPSRAAPETRKQPAEVVSSGTGFFIGRDVIVTNHHVIDGCTELRTRRSGADIGRARVVAVNKDGRRHDGSGQGLPPAQGPQATASPAGGSSGPSGQARHQPKP